MEDDLSRPAWFLDHLFEEFDKWYSQVDEVKHDPASLTKERIDEIAHALRGNFHVSESVTVRMQNRAAAEAAALAEQKFVLELVANNQHIFLEGPAGSGKSHPLVSNTKRQNKAGRRTLMLCWNVLMAAELKTEIGTHTKIDVFDVNALLLNLAELTENPECATHVWYTEELPRLALAALFARPARGGL